MLKGTTLLATMENSHQSEVAISSWPIWMVVCTSFSSTCFLLYYRSLNGPRWSKCSGRLCIIFVVWKRKLQACFCNVAAVLLHAIWSMFLMFCTGRELETWVTKTNGLFKLIGIVSLLPTDIMNSFINIILFNNFFWVFFFFLPTATPSLKYILFISTALVKYKWSRIIN